MLEEGLCANCGNELIDGYCSYCGLPKGEED